MWHGTTERDRGKDQRSFVELPDAGAAFGHPSVLYGPAEGNPEKSPPGDPAEFFKERDGKGRDFPL